MDHTFNNDQFSFEELIKLGTEFYKADNIKLSKAAFEIDQDAIAAASSLFVPAFQWVSAHIAYNGALFAAVKPGTHLAPVVGESGNFWGSLLKDNGNTVSGIGKFSSASPKGADIAAAVFAVLSFVTGQYYMNLNAKRLSKVNGTLHGIEGHIEAEKLSELQQDNETLNEIIEDFNQIVLSSDRLSTCRISVSKLVKNTSKNIKYYSNMLNNLKDRLQQEENEIPFTQKLSEIESLSHKLIFCTYNYGLANIVEMVLFGITNPEDLKRREKRIRTKFDNALDLITEVNDQVDAFMETKDFKKVIKHENTSTLAKVLIHGTVPFPADLLVDKKLTDRKIGKIIESLQSKVSESREALNDFQCTVTPIPLIENYIAMQKKQLILIAKDGKLYGDYKNISSPKFERILLEG